MPWHACAMQFPNFINKLHIWGRSWKNHMHSQRAVKKFSQNHRVMWIRMGGRNVSEFDLAKLSLCRAIELSHSDTAKIICVHTNASNGLWSGTLIQYSAKELHNSKPVNGSAVDILRSRFSLSGERRTAYKQEAWSVYKTFKKLSYVTLCEEGIRIYTDHKNLLFKFHPLLKELVIARHKMTKVARWPLFLSTLNNVIQHGDEKSSDFTDMLISWMNQYWSTTSIICHARKPITYARLPILLHDEKFIRHNLVSILNAKLKSQISIKCTKGDDKNYCISGKLSILDGAKT